jgi:hypothetical protein
VRDSAHVLVQLIRQMQTLIDAYIDLGAQVNRVCVCVCNVLRAANVRRAQPIPRPDDVRHFCTCASCDDAASAENATSERTVGACARSHSEHAGVCVRVCAHESVRVSVRSVCACPRSRCPSLPSRARSSLCASLTRCVTQCTWCGDARADLRTRGRH